MPTILTSRVELTDGTAAVVIDLPQALGGLSAVIDRARAPAVDWDGNGDRVLIYGPGADRRVLTVRGSTAPYNLPPNLGTLTLPGTLTGKVYWPDGTTTTSIAGLCTGLDAVGPDLMGGATSWALTIVGPVSAGWDPVEG
jgi:hypothetical protein